MTTINQRDAVGAATETHASEAEIGARPEIVIIQGRNAIQTEIQVAIGAVIGASTEITNLTRQRWPGPSLG